MAAPFNKLDDAAAGLNMKLDVPKRGFEASLCAMAPGDPDVKAAGQALRDADAADAKGDHAKAKQLRSDASQRLEAYRAGRTAQAALRLVAARPAFSTPPKSLDTVANDLAAGREFGLLGNEQASQAMLAIARSDFSDFAKSEFARLDSDPANIDALLDIAAGAGWLGLDGLMQQGLGQAQGAEKQALTKAIGEVPCPPKKQQLEDLMKAVKQAALMGMDIGQNNPAPGTTLGAMSQAADAYLRSAAQTASAGDRDGLARAAGVFGLGQLSDDLKAGKKVDGPRCAVSAHGHAGEQGVIVADWRAYSCNGMTGAWKADLTVTLFGDTTVFHYAWSFGQVPGGATAAPTTYDLGGRWTRALADYWHEPIPLQSDGKTMTGSYTAKEGTMELGRNLEFMEVVSAVLATPMPIKTDPVAQCK